MLQQLRWFLQPKNILVALATINRRSPNLMLHFQDRRGNGQEGADSDTTRPGSLEPNDQQANSRQTGRESPDNEPVDAMQHEFSVATKKLSSQLTKQR